MRLCWLLTTTHVACATVGVAATGVGLLGGGWALAAGGVAAVGAACLAAAVTGVRLRRSLTEIEHALASGDLEHCQVAGVAEIDCLVARLREYAQRWMETTNRARQQAREIEALLGQLNRRTLAERGWREDAPPARQLRQLLASLAQTAEADLEHVLSSAQEIERRTREMVAGAEEQTSAVHQTTSFVEQMCSNIDSVSQNSEAANRAAVTARESAVAGLDLVRELIRGMDRIRLHVEASGRKLRTLGDHSQEIGSIVETIGAISARTDLLALNASIESVRAGEHGRGFAVVAEEVRKLAEQTAQATREVSSLIESIQAQTQESIEVMAEEHTHVQAEVRRVNEAGVALERISQTSGDSAQRVGEISRATTHQLQVTQEVVRAMQRVSEAAKGIRTRAEGVRGTTQTLTELARELDNSLSPLRRCTEAASGRAADFPSVQTGGRPEACPTTQVQEPEGLALVRAEESVVR
jgi:methyl-accepting chemotaxis protein